MRYLPIGQNEDGSLTVRMFFDDGVAFDQTFTVEEVSPAALLDLLVAPRMREIAASAPAPSVLDDPTSGINLVGDAAAPESAVEVTGG